MIICISGTLYATNTYQASDVSYNDTSVEKALNELYKEIENSALEIRYATISNTTYGTQTLEFDFSNLPNKSELTVDSFITSPFPGSNTILVPYTNTWTNKGINCSNSYDSGTGILTMTLTIINVVDSGSSKMRINIPTAFAIYNP